MSIRVCCQPVRKSNNVHVLFKPHYLQIIGNSCHWQCLGPPCPQQQDCTVVVRMILWTPRSLWATSTLGYSMLPWVLREGLGVSPSLCCALVALWVACKAMQDKAHASAEQKHCPHLPSLVFKTPMSLLASPLLNSTHTVLCKAVPQALLGGCWCVYASGTLYFQQREEKAQVANISCWLVFFFLPCRTLIMPAFLSIRSEVSSQC